MNPATIVIPVHNAPMETSRCLASVMAHTPLSDNCRLLIIDDKSDADGVDEVLGALAHPYISINRNHENLGYTKTINRAISLCPDRDILLLNSDTIVTARWWEKIRCAAYSCPHVGTVTPVSNNAGVFSVPNQGNNILPNEITLDQMAQIVEECGKGQSFQAPTGNGFCMYIRLEVFKEIGLFDDENFPMGYGEENDFCMRAYYAGFLNLVTLDTYIFHAGHASFGSTRHTLMCRGLENLQALYPEYGRLTNEFQTNEKLLAVRELVAKRLLEMATFENDSMPVKQEHPTGFVNPISLATVMYKLFVVGCNTLRTEGPYLCAKKIAKVVASLATPKGRSEFFKKLEVKFSQSVNNSSELLPDETEDCSFVSSSLQSRCKKLLPPGRKVYCIIDHNWGGGAWHYAMRKVRNINARGETAVYLAWNRNWRRVIFVVYAPEGRLVGKVKSIAEVFRLDYIRFSNVLINELVSWETELEGKWQDFPRSVPMLLEEIKAGAKAHGAELRIAIHDFFCICPSYCLLNENDKYCGMPECDSAKCCKCLKNKFGLHVMGFSLRNWRNSWEEIFQYTHKVICFSNSSREIMLAAYPGIEEKIEVIPHEPLVTIVEKYELPKNTPMTIAVIGNLSVAKGLNIVMQLEKLLRDNELLVIIGDCDNFLPRSERIILHGSYQRDNLHKILEKYGVTVGFVASVWPETFNYVTQECMLLGLPLVCFNMGAQAERISQWPHGLIAEEVSAEAAYNALKKLDFKRVKGHL